MERTNFSLLIGQLEREADDHPRLYAIKVALVAALGYLSIALLTTAILTAAWFVFRPLFTGGRFLLQPALACLLGIVTLVILIRALWVRLPEPTGRELTREEAPKLHGMLDELALRMGGLPLDSVTISSEFNASIVQVPHWGVFGNYRNHLDIGLPLLIALSVAEFKAVLAHELGHLAGQHGKFAAWIYRQRTTWHALEARFNEPSNIFEQALGWFYGWYAPYFYAYSFVLARSQEYAADRSAATVAGAGSTASALIKLDLMGRFLTEVFWKKLFDQVRKLPEPPYLPYSLLPRAFKLTEKKWARQDWLRTSLQRYATDADTHPSLAERLAALDVEAMVPAYDEQHSALSLLEPSAKALIRHFDQEWRREHGPLWLKQHEEFQAARSKLAELENIATELLTSDQLWEKANLLLEVEADDDAIEMLSALVARAERVPKAHLLLGRILLSRNQDLGLQHLSTAIQQDRTLAPEAARAGYLYLTERGRQAEAQRFWDKAHVEEAAAVAN